MINRIYKSGIVNGFPHSKDEKVNTLMREKMDDNIFNDA